MSIGDQTCPLPWCEVATLCQRRCLRWLSTLPKVVDTCPRTPLNKVVRWILFPLVPYRWAMNFLLPLWRIFRLPVMQIWCVWNPQAAWPLNSPEPPQILPVQVIITSFMGRKKKRRTSLKSLKSLVRKRILRLQSINITTSVYRPLTTYLWIHYSQSYKVWSSPFVSLPVSLSMMIAVMILFIIYCYIEMLFAILNILDLYDFAHRYRHRLLSHGW